MNSYRCSSCMCPRYIRLQLDLQPDGYHGGVCKVGEHILMVDIMMIIMLLAQSLSPCTWWHSCRQLWPRQPARVQERKDSLSFPGGPSFINHLNRWIPCHCWRCERRCGRCRRTWRRRWHHHRQRRFSQSQSSQRFHQDCSWPKPLRCTCRSSSEVVDGCPTEYSLYWPLIGCLCWLSLSIAIVWSV